MTVASNALRTLLNSKRPRTLLMLTGATVLGSATTFVALRARAAGIPEADALTYTGYIETPDGQPVTTKINVGLRLWDAVDAGNRLCEIEVPDVTPVAGRFQIALPVQCANAIKAKPDTWVEVLIGGAPLGRTKIGAVPYALEAGHATKADVATLGAVDPEGKPARVCTGTTAANAWKPYGDPEKSCQIQVDVDTSACKFSGVPKYVSALVGNTNHWTTTGGSAPYVPTAKGFQIFVHAGATCVTPKNAQDNGWHIEWIAVGN